MKRPFYFEHHGRRIFRAFKNGIQGGRVLTYWFARHETGGTEFDVRALKNWPSDLCIATPAKIKTLLRQAIRKGEL